MSTLAGRDEGVRIHSVVYKKGPGPPNMCTPNMCILNKRNEGTGYEIGKYGRKTRPSLSSTIPTQFNLQAS